MYVWTNFLLAITRLIDIVLTFYIYIIIARALISWVNPDPYNPIVQFLYRVTEPVLNPLRRLVPVWKIGIDLSPIIAILIIYFLQWFLVPTLMQMAHFSI
ncbi:MAG: YggT family protein [Nitrospirae bacterium]|nr:YggT family protein [Nitrospirota bacterium]